MVALLQKNANGVTIYKVSAAGGVLAAAGGDVTASTEIVVSGFYFIN